MANRTRLNLDVDLQYGVVPISKAASSLAALIKRTGATGSPVIVTQKGYPTGVLLPVEVFVALKELAAEHGDAAMGDAPLDDDPVVSLAQEIAAAPQIEEPAPRPAARRRKPAKPTEEEVPA